MPQNLIAKLREQRASLDKLIAEAKRLREEVNAHLRIVHRDDSPNHTDPPPRPERRRKS